MADDSIPKISINPSLALINISRSFSQANNTFGRLSASDKNYKLAGDTSIRQTGGQIADDKTVVYYTGTGGDTLVLPSVSSRSKSIAPFVIIANEGRGMLTVHVQNTGKEFINTTLRTFSVYVGRKVLFISDGLTKWSAWISGNSGSNEAYAHRGGSSLEMWHIANCNNQAVFTTGNPSIDTLRALPFVAPQDNPVLDKVGIQVTTLLAGSARVGVYDTRTAIDIYPNTLVFDSGILDTGTAGVKTATTVQSLIPGNVYWMVHTCNSAATLQCLNLANVSSFLGTNGNLNVLHCGISVARTFAALPATFPAAGVAITAVPIPVIGYRFAANTS